MNQRTYKIRSFSNGKNRQGEPFVNYSLTIPSHIAEKLSRDIQFYCELTEDGLLFRPVPPDQEQVVLPPWAVSENGAEAETKTKRPPRKKPTTKASKPRTRPSRSKPKAEAKTEPETEATPEPDTGAEQPQPEGAAA